LTRARSEKGRDNLALPTGAARSRAGKRRRVPGLKCVHRTFMRGTGGRSSLRRVHQPEKKVAQSCLPKNGQDFATAGGKGELSYGRRPGRNQDRGWGNRISWTERKLCALWCAMQSGEMTDKGARRGERLGKVVENARDQ